MRIDLHTHSWISDGTDSPTRLVLNAQRAGLDVVALTDHDTLAGLDEAREAGRRIGVRVLGGVELSAIQDGTEVHLLGYGPRRNDPQLNAELERLRVGRTERLPKMLAKLEALGMPLSLDEVRAQAAVPLAAGVDLLHHAGAAAVIAHPGIRGMAEVLTGTLLTQLRAEHGLDGIEVDYPLHDPQTRDLYQQLGSRLDLVRTGSSDYHGTGKTGHDLGSATTRASAFDELLRRIQAHGGQID